MPIPKEILAVERPKSTVVKFRLGRYLVVKRTSKRVNGKAKPVDLGTIGEIIDGKYVEIRAMPKKLKKQIDIRPPRITNQRSAIVSLDKRNLAARLFSSQNSLESLAYPV